MVNATDRDGVCRIQRVAESTSGCEAGGSFVKEAAPGWSVGQRGPCRDADGRGKARG